MTIKDQMAKLMEGYTDTPEYRLQQEKKLKKETPKNGITPADTLDTRRVYDYIVRGHEGKVGATDEELMNHIEMHYSKIRWIRYGLMKGGFLREYYERRKTLSGKTAKVYVTTRKYENALKLETEE